MKKVVTALALIVVMFGMVSSVAYAQSRATPEADEVPEADLADTAYARGFDSPAILFSERGDTVATIAVTDVERGWEDYGEFYEPAAGKEFVTVTFEVSMESRGDLVVGSYAFTLLDGYGYMSYAAYVEADPSSDLEPMMEDVTVASGETVELTVVFEVFEGAPLGFLLWQPEFSSFAMVDFTEEDV
jgi:hypothetical protein